MSYRHVLYSYVFVIVEVPEYSTGKLSTQISNYAVRNPKMIYDLIENSTAFSEVAFTNDMYSIHLENLSTSTNTNLKLPGAGLNGPIISRPH